MLWQGLVGISWHTRGFFLLCWFVTITDTASWDDLWNLLVHSWPIESFLSHPQTALDTQVAYMYYASDTMSHDIYYTLDHDSFTLEHNGILKWQFLPEVKTLRGDKATKFSGQSFLVTVVNDSSSVSVSMAAFISEKVLRNWYKLCLSHARLHFGWWPCVTDIPSVLFSVFIVIGWKEIRLAKRICNMHLVTLTLSSDFCNSNSILCSLFGSTQLTLLHNRL